MWIGCCFGAWSDGFLTWPRRFVAPRAALGVRRRLHTLDDPEACGVGATCLLRAELTDAAGAMLYAEEDFTWSTDGPADAGPFGSYLQIAPTAAGTVHVEAEVLGVTASLDLEVE